MNSGRLAAGFGFGAKWACHRAKTAKLGVLRVKVDQAWSEAV